MQNKSSSHFEKGYIDFLLKELNLQIKSLPKVFDFSDVGNLIGYIVASKMRNIVSDKEDFFHGIEHGISLVKEENDKNKKRKKCS